MNKMKLHLCIARESKKEVWENKLLDLIKQEVEAREASEQVKTHITRPPGGAYNWVVLCIYKNFITG